MTTPIEDNERTRRTLVSEVKRLRVLTTSDPARSDELADALVRLTAVRLLGLRFAEAAADAPEAVLLAARILTRNGAAGPYTSPADATRFFTASALLAAIQSGLGQPEAAGRTLAGVDAWVQQLGRFPLRAQLDDTAVIWSLVARSRSVLATDVPLANACADAAAQRLYAAGLEAAPDFLSLTVHLLLADCRWAAGLPDQALAHHRLALGRYRRLRPAAGRLRPGVAELALAPVVELHEPYAQRLELLGDPTFAIAVRRAEVAILEELSVATGPLPAGRAGLARALARDGRGEEAESELAEATALAARSGVELPPEHAAPGPGGQVSWTPLSAAEAFAPDEVPEAPSSRLSQDVQAAVFEGVAARAEAQQAEDRLRAEAEAAAAQRAADREEAEWLAQAQSAAARAAGEERDQRVAAEAAARRDAEEAAARAAADERRRQLAMEHEPQLAVDPAAAEAAAAELAVAGDRVRAAGDDLAALRDAREHLVALLRPLAVVQPDAYRAELIAGLEALVGLRWRLGEPEASRDAAREARSVAGQAGH